jgi:hypothetical protein
MATISKSVVDSDLRARVFADMFTSLEKAELSEGTYQKINDRQFGVILTDKNGTERYVRIGVIVAEEREDMTARELMESEIRAYNEKQAAKAEKAAKRAEKAAKDKAKREKEETNSDSPDQ